MSFRWQKGRFSTSLSRRGGRAGYRLDCALPIVLTLALLAVACGGIVTPTEGDVPVDCDLPWHTMDQVRGCARYDAHLAYGDGRIDVVIPQKNADRIAATLAGAFVVARKGIPYEIVVWAWSKPAVIHSGGGYDRGVVSEQGELGEKLVFEICTEWESLPGPGDLCSDKMEFTIEQDS